MSSKEAWLNLRQIEILCAVIQSKTTVSAAHRLGMSQPAVSNAIRSLESAVGFQLFERLNGRLVATSEALSIFRASERLIVEHESVSALAEDIRRHLQGRLRLCATASPGHAVVPSGLATLLKTHHKIRVSLDIRPLEDVVNQVSTRAADLGFIMGFQEALDRPHFVAAELLEEASMVCAVPKGHPLTRRKSVVASDLVEHPSVILGRETRLGAYLTERLGDFQSKANVVAEVRTCESAMMLAQAGVGIAIIDPFSARYHDRERVVIKSIEPDVPIRLYALWNDGIMKSRLSSALIKVLKKEKPGK